MTLAAELRDVVGAGHVLKAPDLRAPFETDWTRRFHGEASLVVRPADTEQVAGVLAACRAAGAKVVPQGGNTSLAGGSVPRAGEVVLSLTRLDHIGPVDRATAQVSAGAGATLGAVGGVARAAGFEAGLDFAARDSATLGGIVACDAGGLVALRHGTARARVAGLEAVLGDGTVVRRMNGLLKDNAGLNLPALLIGSEGTLGAITAVRWKLVPHLPARTTAIVPLPSIDAAVELLEALRTRVPSVEAAEVMLPDGVELVCAYLGVENPLPPAAAYVLTEAAAATDPTEELAAVLPDDALVATDAAGRARLWRLREGHTEAVNASEVPHKIDIGVPLHHLGEFLERVRGTVAAAAPDSRLVLFGHLADGNVHVNVLGLRADDDRVDEAVLRLATELDGTISAEHGVGIAKARWLGLARGADEIAAMRAVKSALDPSSLLNPGVMLPPA